jgi:AAA+ superfamily predicted ATPase
LSQFNHIIDIAKYGLNNDQEKLLTVLNELIEYSKKTNKVNFALQLQSILKEAIRKQELNGPTPFGSSKFQIREEDKLVNDLIIEKVTSDYRLKNLVCTKEVKNELSYFIKEHHSIDILNKFELPIANKVLFYGPSGCGKTLASYVLTGELKKIMVVINLGAIVSSKLGETSKNLAKLFRSNSNEDSIIFIDEFDSLGKIRDYDQDHGEMKRVVNTILQLLDFLPKNRIVIAATNQIEMIDQALLRRFDLTLKFDLPDIKQIKELITKTLSKGIFYFDNELKAETVLKKCLGLSYFTIQKTLLAAIKRSLMDLDENIQPLKLNIKTQIWQSLVEHEISCKQG